VAAGAAAAPAQAQSIYVQRWNGDMYTTPPDSGCNLSNHMDPVGVVFHGSAATFGNLGSFSGSQYHTGDIEFHVHWDTTSSPSYSYRSYGICDTRQDAELASPGDDRNHLRLWQQKEQHYPGKYQTVGSPHYDRHDSSTCSRAYHYVPPRMNLPGGGTGSGFDYTRRRLLRSYQAARAHRHPARSVYWGNDSLTSQCGGKYLVGSNGWVNIIRVGD
jgi:hypothetical protein